VTAALIAAPVILFLVVAIIMGVVGFMMYSSRREKSLTGTPVLQGRLGGKLGDGKVGGGPVIPVADEEPLVAQKRSAPAPKPAPVAQAPRPNPASVPAARPQPVAPPPAPESTLIAGNTAQATMLSVPVAKSQPSLFILKAPPELSLGSKIPLLPLPFVVGRVEGNLLLKEPNISRRHVEISFDAARNAYLLTDLNSSNGTFVNGQRIPAGQPYLLTAGAVINLGPNVSVRFEMS